MTEPQRTALSEQHVALGAIFTDFGGWDMPLRYGSELAEHRAVRETAGLFDLSHMGEIWVSGADAARFLNTALVGNLARVAVGKAKYSLICTEAGGIIDDLIVYRIAEARFLVVPNAGNAKAVLAALQDRATGFIAGGGEVEIFDATAETSLIAVQGPRSAAILAAVMPETDREALETLGYYAWTTTVIDGVDILLARTGYTGEDGFELYLPNADAGRIWELLLAAGEPFGLLPAGLAARDSLRLEAGMPLYGNELSLETTPFEVGLRAVVSFAKDEGFIGRAALDAARTGEPARVLVGLRGAKRAARSGYPVLAGDRKIGVVTSGQPSPTLGHPIALALIEPAFAEPGTELEVDLRGRPESFAVVALPFYTRQSASGTSSR